MEYTKPWMSIDDQVEFLTKKGLACDSPEKLRARLITIGYYRLSAYWFPYKIVDTSGDTVFRAGTSFEYIMRTYDLDSSLRLLIFEAVGKVEVFLRSRLAYFAAGENGVFGYPSESTLPRRGANNTSSILPVSMGTCTICRPTG